MATLTTTVTVNPAFLQEIKDDNAELRRLQAALRTQFASPSRLNGSPRRALGLLELLRDQLAMHFALEDFYGYFDEPMTSEPRLAIRAEGLRAQHQDLFREVCELTDEAEDMLIGGASAESFKHVAARYRRFDEQFEAHENCERDLMMQAMCDDIGVGD